MYLLRERGRNINVILIIVKREEEGEKMFESPKFKPIKVIHRL